MNRENRKRVRNVLGLVAQFLLVLIAVVTLVARATGKLQANTYNTQALELRVSHIDSTQRGVLAWKKTHSEDHIYLRRNSETLVGYVELLLEAQKIPYPKIAIENN